MNLVTLRSALRQVVLGLIVGSVISVFPVEISLLGACGALIILCLRKYWIGLAIASIVCSVAVQLPLHRLDRKVGPFAYGPTTVEELVQKLREEQRVPLILVDDDLKKSSIVFSVVARLTRREVIERLAAETNAELSYKGCGNGATLLFGSSRVAFLRKSRAVDAAKVD